MAVYLVEGNGKKRLVETRTKVGAINHVASADYKATALNTSDLVKLIKEGFDVETTDKEESDNVAPISDKKEEPESKAPETKVAQKKAA